MRIVCIGDLHLDASLSGYDYHDDVLARLREVSTDGSMVVQMGDVCDPDRGARTFRALRSFSEWVRDARRVGPVSVLCGNHEKFDDHRAGSALDIFKTHPSFCILDVPAIFPIIPGLVGLALPWLSRAHGPFDYEEIAGRLLDEARKKHQRVLAFCHLDITGATPGDEAGMPRLGYLELPRCVMDDPIVERVIAGHIHRAQEVAPKISIVGSLECLGFGERGDDKGFLEVTV